MLSQESNSGSAYSGFPFGCYSQAYYPNGDGLLSLAEAVIRLAVKDLKDGRRYHQGEPDAGEWLERAGLLALAEQAIMEKE